MTFEIELEGSRHHVALRRDRERWIATIGGRELAVSIAAAGDRWSMRANTPEAARASASYDVAVEPAAGGGLVVHVNGFAVPLTVVDPRERWRRGRSHGARGSGPLAIVAPMPGRIVKVLVQPGETVRPRQGLVVVEAMKMENELRAPRAGTVAEVRVVDGASVEAHAVLIVLD